MNPDFNEFPSLNFRSIHTRANVTWATRVPFARKKLTNAIDINRAYTGNATIKSDIICVNARIYGAVRIAPSD